MSLQKQIIMVGVLFEFRVLKLLLHNRSDRDLMERAGYLQPCHYTIGNESFHRKLGFEIDNEKQWLTP